MYFVLTNRFIHSVRNSISMMLMSQMIQHIHRRTQHSNWICHILTSNGRSRIPSARLENGIMIAVIFARQQTGTTSNTANHIRHNCTVQIGHVHHFELMGIRHQLHATIVDDHVVVLDFRIFFGNATWCFQEQTVRQFHNVGLVYGGDASSTGILGVFECVTSHTFTVVIGYDFHALDNTGNALFFDEVNQWVDVPYWKSILTHLVLHHSVFTFGILSYNDNVDVLMTSYDARIWFAFQYVYEQIEFIS